MFWPGGGVSGAPRNAYVKQRKQRNPNSTLLFVLLVGDNFYWMLGLLLVRAWLWQIGAFRALIIRSGFWATL